MANDVKQIKYSELEKAFFEYSQELAQDAPKHLKARPEKGRSAGYAFMQAYFGQMHGTNALCQSLSTLCQNTRARMNDAGAFFKDIDERIAREVQKEG